MKTLATYLNKVVANTSASASVYIDVITSVVGTDGIEDFADVTYSSSTVRTPANADNAQRIVVKSALVAAVTQNAGISVAGKMAYLIDIEGSGGDVSLTLKKGTDHILSNAGIFGTISLSADAGLAISQIKTQASLDRAIALGMTLNAYEGGNPTLPTVTFYDAAVTTTANYENYTNAQAGALVSGSTNLVTSDLVTISVDGLAAAVTMTTAEISVTANIAARIALKLAHAWNLKYGTNGTSANLTYWNDLTTGSTDAITGGSLKSSDSGRGAHGDVVVISASLATTSTLDWKIDTVAATDNAAVGKDIIMVVESSVGGLTGDAITSATLTVAATDGVDVDNFLLLLSNTLRTVVDTNTDTTATIYPVEDRTDTREPEASNEGTVISAGIAAVNHTRVHWLGS